MSKLTGKVAVVTRDSELAIVSVDSFATPAIITRAGPALVLGFYLAVAPTAFGTKHERSLG